MSLPKGSSRRALLRFLACTPAAIAFGAGVAGGQETTQSQCWSDEDEGMRISLNYVEVSPHGAEKDCRNCEFWIPGDTAEACGGCTLIGGAIDPLGYCDSWALTSAPAAAEPPALEGAETPDLEGGEAAPAPTP
jgi:hypothetical protein